VIGSVQQGVVLVVAVVAFGLEIWAFGDAVTRAGAAFVAAGKRTKGFWGALTGVALVVGFISLPVPIGVGGAGFLAILAGVAAIVYLVDVRPAVHANGPRRPPRQASTGGW